MQLQATTRPWERVGSDLFTFDNQEYLLTIDYFSNFPYISKLNTTTSASVIKELKKIFSINGIPEEVITDCGPQFISEEFK